MMQWFWGNAPVSLEARLVETKFRPSGFDYLRIILAAAVIVYHSVITSYGQGAQYELSHSMWRPLIASVLPLFFALSGFLVAGSLERSRTLGAFLGLRVLRIMPALAVEVLLSAFILGAVFTAYPASQYFSDPMFYGYFKNILGDIQYELPGLFLDNPFPKIVNGQLWTLPFELACYILLAGIALLKIFKHRMLLLAFMAGLYGLQVLKMFMEIYHPSGEAATGGFHGRTLLMVFTAGLFIYRFRDKIPFSARLFVVASVISLLLLAVPPHGDRFVALPIAYMTAYLGLLNPRKNKIVLSGDYSYGMFLYGFPIQQAVASMGPQMHEWYINLAISLPCATVFAVFSWWVIEKPALGLRVYLRLMEDRYLLVLDNFKKKR